MAKSEFEFGDQDYGSAYGWDPNEEDRKVREEALAKAKKNNPRVWSEVPSVLLISKASEVVRRTQEYGDVQEFFGPLWRENEIAIGLFHFATGRFFKVEQLGSVKC